MIAPIQKKFNSPRKKDSGHFRPFIIRTGFLGLVFSTLIGCSTFSGPDLSSLKDRPNDEFSPLSEMICFYQGPMNHLSPVRFGECPMYPNCSEYALDAIRAHGFILGWFMTCDRLMRCGRDEIDISPEIIVDGQWKTFDSVDRNDEWLY
jgi:putative component of membrane protein insertase Oxa1/YidC/SpoIIIJ protein YidD